MQIRCPSCKRDARYLVRDYWHCSCGSLFKPDMPNCLFCELPVDHTAVEYRFSWEGKPRWTHTACIEKYEQEVAEIEANSEALATIPCPNCKETGISCYPGCYCPEEQEEFWCQNCESDIDQDWIIAEIAKIRGDIK